MDFCNFYAEYFSSKNNLNAAWLLNKYTLYSYVYFIPTSKITEDLVLQSRPWFLGTFCSMLSIDTVVNCTYDVFSNDITFISLQSLNSCYKK